MAFDINSVIIMYLAMGAVFSIFARKHYGKYAVFVALIVVIVWFPLVLWGVKKK